MDASVLLDALLFVVPVFHVLNAPYTKVEESFNLHATHDVLMYGVAPSAIHNYDHFIFPGAVPRSFIGSVLLAWFTTPWLHAAKMIGLLQSKAQLQLAVRLVMAVANSFGLWYITRATSRRFGRLAGRFYTLLTCTQFHVPYWMGRTLPNMFAFLPVNVAFALVMMPRKANSNEEKRWLIAIGLITSATTIFRAELAMYLAPLTLQALLSRKCSISNVILVGLFAGVASAALSTAVDSYFWDQYPLWPELYTIYFNIIQGKSAEWGVSPFHTYFAAFLPKLLLVSLPLSLLGLTVDRHARELVWAPLAFVTLISFIGHKEWRFIVYIVPVMNVVAARGASWVFKQRYRTLFHKILALAVIAGLLGNIAVSILLTAASKANYPGGEALQKLHQDFSSIARADIYIDDLAAQSGASLFLQAYSPPYGPYLAKPAQDWSYDKTANRTDLSTFDFAIVEPKEIPSGNPGWGVVGTVQAFSGRFMPIEWLLGIPRGGWRKPMPKTVVETVDVLWIISQGR